MERKPQAGLPPICSPRLNLPDVIIKERVWAESDAAACRFFKEGKIGARITTHQVGVERDDEVSGGTFFSFCSFHFVSASFVFVVSIVSTTSLTA
jgi:hypothetical protein